MLLARVSNSLNITLLLVNSETYR